MTRSASSGAFDSSAAGYDEVAGSRLGQELRRRVHAVVQERILCGGVGEMVLDLGCGTGIDLVWLAEAGATPIGLDASSAMLEVAKDKLGSGVGLIHASLDSEEWPDKVDEVLAGRPLSHVIANFGVLNCVSDRRRVATCLAERMEVGTGVTIVAMARWCPSEFVGGLLSLDLARATRRMSGSAFHEDRDEVVAYPSLRCLRSEFAPGFKLVHHESLGWVLPTFEQRRWLERHHRLGDFLASVDRLGSRPASVLGLGDHRIMVFERGPS